MGPELIGSRLECVVLLARLRVLLLVSFGQTIMSVRTHDRHKANVIEALRRAKFKYPGRQKIYVSRKWGFTKFDREDFETMLANGRLKPDGVSVQYKPEHGPLNAWKRTQLEL